MEKMKIALGVFVVEINVYLFHGSNLRRVQIFDFHDQLIFLFIA